MQCNGSTRMYTVATQQVLAYFLPTRRVVVAVVVGVVILEGVVAAVRDK